MSDGLDSPLPESLAVLWTHGPFSGQARQLPLETDVAAEHMPDVPSGLRDGDVLVYMSGRLHLVDHRVPQTLDVDLAPNPTAP